MALPPPCERVNRSWPEDRAFCGVYGAGSAFGPARFALFKESGDPLGRFAVLPAPDQNLGRHGDHLVVDGRGECEKMALGRGDRARSAGEIGHHLGFDERIQVVGRTDPCNKTQPLRLGRSENPARHENPPGHRRPQLGHHIGADGGRHEAELGLGQAKLCGLDADGHVADADDPDPAAEGIALNAGNDRFGNCIYGPKHPRELVGRASLGVFAACHLVAHPAKIASGAETGSAARDDHDPHVGIGTQTLGRIGQLVHHLRRERIMLVLAGQLERGNAAPVPADGNGLKLAEASASKLKVKKVSLFHNFGTAHFKYKDLDVEFVGARKESYRHDSRKPIVENGTLIDDQNRRDFTINALALNLSKSKYGELMDPFDGLNDLEKGIIRTPLDPVVTYSDDPLRMLRAIRFASQLGFIIESNTLLGISDAAHRISIISQERITDEFNKILLSRKPSVGLDLLYKTGLLKIIFPQMVDLAGAEYIDGKGHKDNFYHTLQVIDNVAENSNNLWLRWAALLHDIAKPATKRFEEGTGWTFHGHEVVGGRMVPKIFTKLKLPMQENMRYVRKLVELHLRPISLTKENITDSAIRRLLFDGGDDLEDLMTLCDADITSKNEAKVKRFRNNFEMVRIRLKEVEEKDKVRNWQPPITGELIMETFKLQPCKEVGLIKTAIREAILDGVIENSYDAAFAMMMEHGKELGLGGN